MAEIAAFVQTPTARWYSATCREFGVDPAAFLDDGVLAFNLRAGLMWRSAEERAEEERAAQAAGADVFADTRAAGAEVRARAEGMA